MHAALYLKCPRAEETLLFRKNIIIGSSRRVHTCIVYARVQSMIHYR